FTFFLVGSIVNQLKDLVDGDIFFFFWVGTGAAQDWLFADLITLLQDIDAIFTSPRHGGIDTKGFDQFSEFIPVTVDGVSLGLLAHLIAHEHKIEWCSWDLRIFLVWEGEISLHEKKTAVVTNAFQFCALLRKLAATCQLEQ